MVTDNPILPRMVPSPSQPCETCGKEKCDGTDKYHRYDPSTCNACHGSCQPKSESLKCCDKAFVWSGGEGTSHMCCNVHCCVPETDFEQLEKNIDKILEKAPTPPKERCGTCSSDGDFECPECCAKCSHLTPSRAEGWEEGNNSNNGTSMELPNLEMKNLPTKIVLRDADGKVTGEKGFTYDRKAYENLAEHFSKTLEALLNKHKKDLLSSRQSSIEECVKAVEKAGNSGMFNHILKDETLANLRRLLREESEDKKDG